MFKPYYKFLINLIWVTIIQCQPTNQIKNNQTNQKPTASPTVQESNRNVSVWTVDYEFGDGDEIKSTEFFVCSFYNDILKEFLERNCYINLDIKNERLGIYQTDGVYYYILYFNDDERKGLLDSLDKYFKWEEIAVKKKENVEKDITTIYTTAIWGIQNQAYGDTEYDEITVKFFSQNMFRHQLIIYYPKFNSDFGVINSPPMYLEKESVKKLHNLLQNKSINDAILKIQKQIREQNESYK